MSKPPRSNFTEFLQYSAPLERDLIFSPQSVPPGSQHPYFKSRCQPHLFFLSLLLSLYRLSCFRVNSEPRSPLYVGVPLKSAQQSFLAEACGPPLMNRIPLGSSGQRTLTLAIRFSPRYLSLKTPNSMNHASPAQTLRRPLALMGFWVVSQVVSENLSPFVL